VVAVVTFSMVISGSVSDFDRDSYKERLAATLSGVMTQDIIINIASASVSVIARIAIATDAMVNSTMSTLSAQTPESLSAALGVQVVSVMPPMLTRRESRLDNNETSSEAPLSSGNEDSTVHVVLYVVIGVFLALLIIACGWVFGFCRGFARKGQYNGARTTFTTFETMDNTVVQTKSTTSNNALDRARSANAARARIGLGASAREEVHDGKGLSLFDLHSPAEAKNDELKVLDETDPDDDRRV